MSAAEIQPFSLLPPCYSAPATQRSAAKTAQGRSLQVQMLLADIPIDQCEEMVRDWTANYRC